MNRILTKRLALALMTLAVACLASAVFLWGTEYKVSLYPHGHRSRPAVPFAKLLSERERPATGSEVALRAGGQALITLFSLSFLVIPLEQADCELFPSGILQRSAIVSTHRTPCLFRFSFRPPPPVAV